MTIDEIFENKKPDFHKLLQYGFKNNDNLYTYDTSIVKNQFLMTVVISVDGQIYTKVTDAESGEEYVLHRSLSAVGEFVGQVREEHDRVLSEIADFCFTSSVFKTKIASEIIDYVRKKYGDELEFLWPRFPQDAVLRRKDTGKWYAVLLVISKNKLGINSDEIVEIIDFRISPEAAEQLFKQDNYYPGYHMNKKHWATVCLDGSVPLNEILERIDDSYQLAIK